jgi:NADPH-dependent 2,4-dienoyl-CoA reductase/sulfur reductase-like enzyme
VELKGIKQAETPKDVMIVGGGPAGMEAARWLKRRGHRPAIYEKSDRLGGQLLLASLPPHKEEIDTLREFQVKQIGKLGIEVNFMTEVTPELILDKKPDAVIVAIGAKQIEPNVPIDEKMKCFNAWDVMTREEFISGKDIVVLGGGFVAAEIAEMIAEEGKYVTIIGRRHQIAFDMEPKSRQVLIGRLDALNVQMVVQTHVEEVTDKMVKGRNRDDGSVVEVHADTVVNALGLESLQFSTQAIEKAGIDTYVIGDSKEVNGIAEAVRDGFVAGTTI